MSERRRLLGNMASLLTLQGANYILPLITLPYLVRVLGAENFGLIAFAQVFIQYFVVATDYGFNLSGTRDIALYRNDENKLNEIIAAIMAIKIFLMSFGFLIVVCLTLIFTTFSKHSSLYLIIYLTVAGNTIFPTWLFQGLELMKQLTWINIAGRSITTIATFIFISRADQYVLSAAIQSLPLIIASIPAWISVTRYKSVRWRRPKLSTVKDQIYNGWYVFVSTTAITVYTGSNAFVLGLILGPTAVGYYAIASKIAAAISGLYQPINRALYPHISQLANFSKVKAIIFVSKVYKYYVYSGFVASVLLFLFSEQIIVLVGGFRYLSSVVVLRILSSLPLILSFGHVIGGLTMLPLGLYKIFSRVLLVAMAVDLLVVYPLIDYYGVAGAALSTVISELTVTSILIFYSINKNIYTPIIAEK